MKSIFFACFVPVLQKLGLGLVSIAILGVVGNGNLLVTLSHSQPVKPHCWWYSVQPGENLGYSRIINGSLTRINAPTAHPSHDKNFPGQRFCISTPPKPAPAHKQVAARQYTPTPQPVYHPAYQPPGPTPTPPPPPPGRGSVVSLIDSVFGPYASAAIHVAECESGLNPNAYNPYGVGGSHAEGVFQILYPSTWDGTPEASQSPYNAMANILAAHAIFSRDGNSWRAWTCQP